MVVLSSSQILSITARSVLGAVFVCRWLTQAVSELFMKWLFTVHWRRIVCSLCVVSGYEWLDPMSADGWKATLWSKRVSPPAPACSAAEPQKAGWGGEQTRWLICLWCSEQAECHNILSITPSVVSDAMDQFELMPPCKHWPSPRCWVFETTPTISKNKMKDSLKLLWCDC